MTLQELAESMIPDFMEMEVSTVNLEDPDVDQAIEISASCDDSTYKHQIAVSNDVVELGDPEQLYRAEITRTVSDLAQEATEDRENDDQI